MEKRVIQWTGDNYDELAKFVGIGHDLHRAAGSGTPALINVYRHQLHYQIEECRRPLRPASHEGVAPGEWLRRDDEGRLWILSKDSVLAKAAAELDDAREWRSLTSDLCPLCGKPARKVSVRWGGQELPITECACVPSDRYFMQVTGTKSYTPRTIGEMRRDKTLQIKIDPACGANAPTGTMSPAAIEALGLGAPSTCGAVQLEEMMRKVEEMMRKVEEMMRKVEEFGGQPDEIRIEYAGNVTSFEPGFFDYERYWVRDTKSDQYIIDGLPQDEIEKRWEARGRECTYGVGGYGQLTPPQERYARRWHEEALRLMQDNARATEAEQVVLDMDWE